ncbi:endonuclease/exonuclease/phosphatase family protein [Pseudomonas sp. TH08]|uniref:endonuclease/exonuclease/phosphatase family protein n=1 Tax=unclassified Pseudomonas TaxID=196821 RepID=UPI0019132406|nr:MULTISPECIES: endonuclease/exonuclease/phosphatase family protein [unclassified Pseudomonas]MBK5530303.1 endonuclease/exonuclease/phosphatase family protein [Pseudomonas sp. TH06]MBK5535152.1 endonuclease/exonuclease/phosphatase family protein [Pseudomonas sp. TH08]
MRIGSFNVEKNGKSSTLDKQTQVDFFIHNCCTSDAWDADIVFLCEIHSAQVDNYRSNLAAIYKTYSVYAFDGGYSNAYIVLVKSFETLQVCSQGSLFGLNRDLIAVEANGVKGYTGYVFLAHFKSGQTGLTRSQLKSCTALGGRWVATGDLNLDYANVGQLDTAGLAYDCWGGQQTQSKGGILDWVLASADVTVKVVDITGLAHVFDMSGPDHRPILFDVTG